MNPLRSKIATVVSEYHYVHGKSLTGQAIQDVTDRIMSFLENEGGEKCCERCDRGYCDNDSCLCHQKDTPPIHTPSEEWEKEFVSMFEEMFLRQQIHNRRELTKTFIKSLLASERERVVKIIEGMKDTYTRDEQYDDYSVSVAFDRLLTTLKDTNH